MKSNDISLNDTKQFSTDRLRGLEVVYSVHMALDLCRNGDVNWIQAAPSV